MQMLNTLHQCHPMHSIDLILEMGILRSTLPTLINLVIMKASYLLSFNHTVRIFRFLSFATPGQVQQAYAAS